MTILGKITALLKRRKRSPNYTRRQWIMKAIMCFVAFVGMDLTGAKIGSYDYQVAVGTLTAEVAYDGYYAYLCGVEGFFMAMALWRLLEMFWWAKDHLETGNITANPVENGNFYKILARVKEKLYSFTIHDRSKNLEAR